MCPAAPVTATLIGVFMAQLAINVSLSKAKANYMSWRARSRHPVNLLVRFATGFIDFAQHDTVKISGKF
jgi:hypothetical protein